MNGGIGLDRLSLNQATVKHLNLAEAVALCVRHYIPAIGLWRDRVRAGWPGRGGGHDSRGRAAGL